MITNFIATAVSREIKLNLIAEHFGISKKFKWEEFLVLKDAHLKGIIREEKEKAVYLFHYGCIVGVNLQKHEITDIYNYIAKIDTELKATNPLLYTETFGLEIDPNQEPTLNNKNYVANTLLNYHYDIISIILAKSVALERVEQSLEYVLDDIENLIDLLDTGKFNVSDDKIAKLSAKILRYKYNSISYLMVLDKPDITWSNEGAEDLFLLLQDFFDLPERYENIDNKTKTIMDITGVVTLFSQSKRGTRLEWIIIILIAFEIVFALWDKFFG